MSRHQDSYTDYVTCRHHLTDVNGSISVNRNRVDIPMFSPSSDGARHLVTRPAKPHTNESKLSDYGSARYDACHLVGVAALEMIASTNCHH